MFISTRISTTKEIKRGFDLNKLFNEKNGNGRAGYKQFQRKDL
jgi:hypothetical protein